MEQRGGAPFGRLVNTERICFDEEHMRRFHGCPYIVGVDIFPLDCVPKDKDEDETWHLLLRFLSALSGKIKENGNREPTEEILSGLTSVNEWCGFVFDRQKDLNAQIRTLMLQLVQCYQSEEAAELELAVWDWAKERRLKYKREWYAESIEVPFENITIPIPYGYDEVLRVLYGDNYMTPVQNAADHDYPFYKSQDRELERRKGKG